MPLSSCTHTTLVGICRALQARTSTTLQFAAPAPRRSCIRRASSSSFDSEDISNLDPSRPSSRPPEFRGFGRPPARDENKADALRESLAGVSNAQGRKPKGTNIILGDAATEDKWRELDAQVSHAILNQLHLFFFFFFFLFSCVVSTVNNEMNPFCIGYKTLSKR
jgi:hypothetical protein